MTAALAKPEIKAPLPADVDERAEAFHKLEEKLVKAKAEQKSAQENLTASESELIALVRSFGGPHATKSKILHGIIWEMVATFAQYSTTDNGAIERFRLALVEAGLTRLMKKIFKEESRWTMLSSAAEIVKNEKLSPRLMALLLQCTVTGDKKPSLDVRMKKKSA